MECSSYRLLINGYIDEELSHEELATLRAHFPQCYECQAYLKRMETMKTAFKHYRLFQPTPEIPEHFVQRVSTQIEGIVRESPPPVAARISGLYRTFALQLADRWAGSLRTRPFAWTTAASFLVLCIAGGILFTIPPFDNMASTANMASRSPDPSSQTATPPALHPGGHDEYFPEAPLESLIRFEEPDDSGSYDTEVVKFADAPFIRVAQNEVGSVENYVYSHILEGYPNHLIDSVVFVGYVQNGFIE